MGLVPKFEAAGCEMFGGTKMATMLEEIAGRSQQGGIFLQAISAAIEVKRKEDVKIARQRWKEFMAEALSGNGKGAHAIIKQANLETCSILGP
eukprot:5369669-Pyramimonas_sp.AAC.1